MKPAINLPPPAVHFLALSFLFIHSIPIADSANQHKNQTISRSWNPVTRPQKPPLQTIAKKAPDPKAKHYLNYLDPVEANAWPEENLPVHVSIKPASKVKGFKPEMIKIFKDSCADWTEATEDRIKFEFGLRAEEGNGIKLRFSDDRRGIKNGTAGQTVCQHDEKGIYISEITIFTRDHLGRYYPPASLKHTCLHEIGHALGIIGHSPFDDDIMVASHYDDPSIPLDQIKPSKRDRNTVNFIYNNAETFFSRAYHKVRKDIYHERENASKELDELATTYDGPDVRRAIAGLRKIHQSLNQQFERFSRSAHQKAAPHKKA
ncbi:MAG: hypothetical protein K2Z81_10400 [Cyanobacteria bacterium]|nr:hypothetical protein [Cyanobacteriota bacterium]